MIVVHNDHTNSIHDISKACIIVDTTKQPQGNLIVIKLKYTKSMYGWKDEWIALVRTKPGWPTFQSN
jgi:hypothetical protein